MKDLIERLRANRVTYENGFVLDDTEIFDEAADALEAAEQQLKNAAGALEFATNDPEGWQKALNPELSGERMTLEEFKRYVAEISEDQ